MMKIVFVRFQEAESRGLKLVNCQPWCAGCGDAHSLIAELQKFISFLAGSGVKQSNSPEAKKVLECVF